MSVPVLFGCPLYKNMKRRVANKYIKHFWRGRSLNSDYWSEWSKRIGHLKVGDLFRDCSGANVRITYTEPRYRGIGNGQILVEIDIGTHLGGSCGLFSCGPDVAITQAEAESYRREILNRPDAKNWNWDISYSPEVMTINEDGTTTINHELQKKLLDERKNNDSQRSS